jgi:hypothetical protein
MSEGLWPRPRRLDVGEFSDLTLYPEALQLAQDQQGITAIRLQHELRPRFRSLRFVENQSASAARKLVAELRLFGWLDVPGTDGRQDAHLAARLTQQGRDALAAARGDWRGFLRCLAERMHDVYVVPGWFVNRLWTINPQQGEVILPAPSAGWSPTRATREARAWTAELRDQTLQAAGSARAANSLAFPVDDANWQDAVRRAWERLRDRKRRQAVSGPDPVTGSRSGLTLAMRWATLRLLFGRAPFPQGEPDFQGERPLTPKTFKPWCPRLQALELIGYTDWHPQVAGRLLFPTALFRTSGAADQFEELPGIRHPDGRPLFLHQPAWEPCRERYWQTLVAVYEETFRRVRARYVSLPDVRDEVCRRLRLSPARFDLFLEHALAEVPQEGGWHLSIETDTREDLRTGRGLLRRPVYVRSVPHTLVAVARLPRVPRSAS